MAFISLVLGTGLVSVSPLTAGEGSTYAGYGVPATSNKTVSADGKIAVTKAQCALEKLRNAVEEWGTLTVSAPIVVLDTGQFDLGANTDFEGTKAYIDRARSSLQGGATQTSSTSIDNSLNIQVTPNFSVDPSGKKTSLGNAATALDPSAQGAAPTSVASTGDTPAPEATPGSLLRPAATASTSFQLSDTVAVPTGESAKITELLGRAMANPAKSRFTNPEMTVHFAIVQISCNPGWRTRGNYIGDVTATCELYQSKTQVFQPESDQKRPQVFSVLPLFDAQTLELASSERQLTQLVGQLAAAYPTSFANFRASDLIKLTKQFQSDTATRTPRTVTNAYSTGSSFGFRFSPSLVALKDPAQRHSGAANVLQATSFPALVTIIVDAQHAADEQYDSVLVHVAHHWFINDRPPAFAFWRRWGLALKRDRVADNYDLTWAVDEARDAVYGLPDLRESRLGPDTPTTVAMLYRQYQELRAKAVGTSRPVFSFPWASEHRARNAAPIISDVTPRQIVKSAPVAMVVRGFNFLGSADQYQVWLGQRRGNVQVLRENRVQGDQMFVTFPVATDSGPSQEEGLVPLIVVGPHGMDTKVDAVEIVKAADVPVPVKTGNQPPSGAAHAPASPSVPSPAPGMPSSAAPLPEADAAAFSPAPVRSANPLFSRERLVGAWDFEWDPTLPPLPLTFMATTQALASQPNGDFGLPLP